MFKIFSNESSNPYFIRQLNIETNRYEFPLNMSVFILYECVYKLDHETHRWHF